MLCIMVPSPISSRPALPGLATENRTPVGWRPRAMSSAGGIALILTRPFERGTILIVELACNPVETRRIIEVVHVAPEPDGRWVIGCVFASPLAEDELQVLLSQQPFPAA
jgi:hypothetical protein